MEKERYSKDDLRLIDFGNLIKEVEIVDEKKKLISKLLAEYKELMDKLVKLKVFLSYRDTFNKIGFAHYSLLKKQRDYMDGYAETLLKRIELLGETN